MGESPRREGAGVIELDNANEPIFDDRDRHRYPEERWNESFNCKLDRYVQLARHYSGTPSGSVFEVDLD